MFRWIISWQAYGGARALPLTRLLRGRRRAVVSGDNLEAAIATGDALELDGGASLSTTLVAEVVRVDG